MAVSDVAVVDWHLKSPLVFVPLDVPPPLPRFLRACAPFEWEDLIVEGKRPEEGSSFLCDFNSVHPRPRIDLRESPAATGKSPISCLIAGFA